MDLYTFPHLGSGMIRVPLPLSDRKILLRNLGTFVHVYMYFQQTSNHGLSYTLGITYLLNNWCGLKVFVDIITLAVLRYDAYPYVYEYFQTRKSQLFGNSYPQSIMN